MSIGITATITKSILDQKLGDCPLQIKRSLNNAVSLKAFMDQFSDEALQTDPFNYTVEDVANARAMLNELTKLSSVSTDFFTFASKLWGFGV